MERDEKTEDCRHTCCGVKLYCWSMHHYRNYKTGYHRYHVGYDLCDMIGLGICIQQYARFAICVGNTGFRHPLSLPMIFCSLQRDTTLPISWILRAQRKAPTAMQGQHQKQRASVSPLCLHHDLTKYTTYLCTQPFKGNFSMSKVNYPTRMSPSGISNSLLFSYTKNNRIKRQFHAAVRTNSRYP